MTLLQTGGDQLLATALVHWLAAAVLGLGALTVIGTALTQPGRRRASLAVGIVACGVLALAHGAVALEVPQDLGIDASAAADVARLAGYAAVLPLALGLLGRAAGLRKWLLATLGVVAVGHVAALGGWLLLEGELALAALGTAGLLVPIGAYAVLVALQTAGTRSRRLLVVRLSSLVGLVWAVAVLAMGLSPRGVGVLDGYTAAVLGGYLDVVFGTGVGALLARSGDALDDLAGATTSEDADDGVGDAVAAPAPDDEQQGVEPGVEAATADAPEEASAAVDAGSASTAVDDDSSTGAEDDVASTGAGDGDASTGAGDDSSPTAGDGGTVAPPENGTDAGRDR